jgi:5-methylcytosine-specific restriction protein A
MRKNRGRRWMRIRALVLAEEPLCTLYCKDVGRTRASTEVDHIIALEDGGTDERANLRGVCDECHKIKHGAAPRIGVDGWPER